MKRIFALLLALVMVFSFAACGQEEKKDGDNSGNSAYADLSIMPGVELGVEEYAIAFRKDSDMVSKVDEISKRLFENGTLGTIAEKYDLTEQLVPTFEAASGNAKDGDWAKIQSAGKMRIGVTEYDPMDYLDENGKWVGFDAEYAEAVCKELGVAAEFVVIDWNTKLMSLETGAIDCIWNGMTVTGEITAAASVTGAYMKNYQVVVVKDADKFPDLASLKGKKIAVEGGSAGQAAAEADANLSEQVVEVQDQATALLQVKSGAAEACVIDFVMAKTLIG